MAIAISLSLASLIANTGTSWSLGPLSWPASRSLGTSLALFSRRLTAKSVRPLPQASFAGARTVSMDFLDGKLTTLWIGYDGSFKWQKLDEFIAGTSKDLNLPASWPAKGPGRELRCDSFSVFASMIGGSPALRIANDEALTRIATRREEVAAAKETAEAAAAAIVIGDTRTKLYYPNDCDEVDKVPVTNRVTFKDKEEAEKAGYKRARDCP